MGEWPLPLYPMLVKKLMIVFCLLTGLYGQAQSPVGVNPFELAHRLPKTVAAVSSGTGNPFDVVAHRAPGAVKSLSDETAVPSGPRRPLLAFPQGNTLSKAFIFVVLVVILLFFTFAATTNRSALLKAWRSFLSSNALNLAQREAHGFAGNTPYFLLYINFLLNAGVFVFLVIQAFSPDQRYNNFTVFASSMTGVTGILLLKHFGLTVFGWLFEGLKATFDRYKFLIMIFSCVLGLFLIPFNFLIAFAGAAEWQRFVTLWLLALSVIFVGYGLFRAFSLGLKHLFAYPLHFLLYLCAAEIIPVLLITKMLF